jgi:hypothetical protein
VKAIFTTCTVCRNNAECEHFDLYVIGSEGVWLCLPCRIEVTEFIGRQMAEHGRAKVQAVLERKRRDGAQ